MQDDPTVTGEAPYKLLPCPFCEAQPIWRYGKWNGPDGAVLYSVECPKCEAQINSFVIAEAAANAWNSRPLLARLAALEQAAPEEVASAAADAMERETAAINAERIDGHEMPRMYRQEKERMTRAVLSASAPRLRAQGAVAERERAAAVCEEIAEVYERQDQTGDAARECAVMIRTGGSGG